MRSARSTYSTSGYLLAAGTSAGLAVLVIGSFLPWLRSGNVRRNSYESAGLAEHFGLVDNVVLSTLLRAWIAVPALSVIGVALFALGLPRVAAALVLPVSTLVGTVSGALSVQAGDPTGLVGITPMGPVTSLTGAVIALIGALGVLMIAGRARTTADGRAGTHS